MKIVINGVPPWDGDYEFDNLSDLTNRELHRIKEISGVRGGELIESLSSGDSGAWVGLAVVILARHSKVVDPEDFWNAPNEAIDFNAEADADPPTRPLSGSGPGSPPESSGAGTPSGSV